MRDGNLAKFRSRAAWIAASLLALLIARAFIAVHVVTGVFHGLQEGQWGYTWAWVVGFAATMFLTNRLDRKSLSPQSDERNTGGEDATYRPPARLGSPVSPEAASFFTTMIVNPARHIGRIKESVSLLTRAHAVTSRYWVTVPEALQGMVVHIPILSPPKGVLLDDLHLADVNGAELATLAFDEGMALLKESMSSLVGAAGASVRAEYATSLEDDLLAQLASRAPSLGTGVEASMRSLTAGRLLGRLEEMTRESEWANSIQTLATRMTSHYAIVCIVPVPKDSSSIVIEVRRRLVLTKSRGDRRNVIRATVSAWETLKLALGIRPSTFHFPLEAGGRCQSYHLEFFGPAGTYLARQSVTAKATDGSSYIRFRNRLGQRYSHLYLRGGDEQLNDESASFTFYERNPGSIAYASLSAAGALLGLYCAATVAGADGSLTGNADVIAALLALPLVASSFIGLNDAGSLSGGVFTARLSSIATLLLASTGLVRFFQEAAGAGAVLSVSWDQLLTGAAINALLTTSSWVRRALSQGFLLTKREKVG